MTDLERAARAALEDENVTVEYLLHLIRELLRALASR
jgi:hypothetical protein